MASRYLITGVQLGILMSLSSQSEDAMILLNQIEDLQYVGNSNEAITTDVSTIIHTEIIS